MAGISSDIKGYRELSDDDVNVINAIKKLEIEVGAAWSHIFESHTGVDKRWMNIAKTHFQEGFSAFIRAIAQPEDVYK